MALKVAVMVVVAVGEAVSVTVGVGETVGLHVGVPEGVTVGLWGLPASFNSSKSSNA